MATRRKRVQEIQLTPETSIDVEVSYHDGSLWQKGYTLHAQIVRRERTPGVTYTILTGGEGIRELIEPANRFNQRKLDALSESLQHHERLPYMIDYCRQIFERKQISELSKSAAARLHESR